MGKKFKKNEVEDNEEESYDPHSDSAIVDDPEMYYAKKEENDYVMSNYSSDNEDDKQKVNDEAKKEGKTKENKSLKTIQRSKTGEFNELLDSNYDIDKNYFYQMLTNSQWEEIKNYLEQFVKNKQTNEQELNEFLDKFPEISKGSDNSEKLLKIINEIPEQELSTYKILTNTYIKKYLTAKPSVLSCYFFPNNQNEQYVANMIRTCKQTLDIAIFTLTNNAICAAIQEAFTRGVKVRIIADDECCKMWGSDVYILAAMGIPCKTDSAVKYHMHHKVAILDNSVLVTGSFNWTSQAVKYNQENILFYENKELCQKYTEEFDKLWNSFNTTIDQKEAKKIVDEEAEKKKKEKEKREKEKAKKDAIKAKEKAKKEKLKAKEKAKKEKEKAKLEKEKAIQKAKKEKEREKLKKQKEKEKEKKRKEKEKAKKKKQAAK